FRRVPRRFGLTAMLLGRLQVPPKAKRGEAFEIRVLVQHPMENGFRRDLNGNAIPLNVLNHVACRYGGKEVFSAELGSGISANPYLSFFATADASGEVQVEWSDDRGQAGGAVAKIEVT
ncbi:MAG: thiosulfate oxidation carrier complex protein SoxZ, partial [Bacillota bacterium]